jgi:WD40 repeat protein
MKRFRHFDHWEKSSARILLRSVRWSVHYVAFRGEIATVLCSIVLLFSCLFANAQMRQVAKIDTLAKAILVDNLDNVYLLSPKDELLKYDSGGKLRWRYSNNRFGKLHSIDVSDPLRVVLFYNDFQQVQILNNNLNEITSYSFARNGNLLVSAVASTNNNGLWIFDRASNMLIKLSGNFTEDIRSANLYQLFGEMIDPKKLVASDQYVFVQKKNSEILQFDRFGAYVKTLPIDSLSDFNMTSNIIAYLKNGQLVKYNLNSFESSQTKLPVAPPIKQVAVGNKLIVVLTEKAVFLLSDN